MLWGILPVFLQLCLQVMDSSTITWFRFLVAAAFVGGVLLSRRAIPNIRALPKPTIVILLVAALALVANYVGNVEALDYVNPETVQVVMQLAPLMLMLGGIVFYKERFNRMEMLGATILIVGLLLFFNDRLDALFGAVNRFNTGVFLTIVAATFWAGYALLQKLLLVHLNAKQLTFSIYVLGIIVLLPMADLGKVLELNTLQFFALLFCCANTIVAYGAFTEALSIWNASKVSAVLATSPVFAFLSVWVAEQTLPEFFALSALDGLAYLGAVLVVSGSILTALAKPKPAQKLPQFND